jgi:hypothetical protein
VTPPPGLQEDVRMSYARGGEDREEKFIDMKILQRETTTLTRLPLLGS